MIFKVGPFTFYRVEEGGTLCVTLSVLDNWPCGWEYGWEDPAADRKAWLKLNIGKLIVFSFEGWLSDEHWVGFELWLFGFWVIW